MWCGDFNAHSTLWESANNYQNGNVKEQMLDCSDLVCLNNGSITRLDVVRGSNSVLDLTTVSNYLARQCEWGVLDHSNMGSDHYPIKCSIGIETEVCQEEKIPRWRFKAADWDKFKDGCEGKMISTKFNFEDVEDVNNKINMIV